jgi:hypothetical protein
MISNIIQATPYSCANDLNSLILQKQIIDYHVKNFGNSSKSTISAEELKKRQEQYVIDKKKYDESDCGIDSQRDDCINLQGQITSLQSTITYLRSIRNIKLADERKIQLEGLQKKFNDSKCSDEIGKFRAEYVNSVSDAFQAIDKLRIEQESKYLLKKRVFFGGIIILGALFIINVYGKKE